ncbi:MAG: hypothetical protein IPH04_19740 [Saprospirales bacterium]|nr:hypothetical protein [Saprospirales bacterium]
MKQFYPYRFFICVTTLSAQAPQGINYQAVARGVDQKPKPNVPVNVTIKIKMPLWAQSCIPKPTTKRPITLAFSIL